MADNHCFHLLGNIGVSKPAQFTYPFCYSPHPLAIMAKDEVTVYIETHYPANVSLNEGKMMGVLVAEDSRGNVGFIAAFSGHVQGLHDDAFFVPPIYDLTVPDGEFRRGEAEITELNRKIRKLENDSDLAGLETERKTLMAAQIAEERNMRLKFDHDKEQRRSIRAKGNLTAEQSESLARESQFQKAEMKRMRLRHAHNSAVIENEIARRREEIDRLKTLRRQMSENLQQRIFRLFVVKNAVGESATIEDVFAQYHRENGEPASLPPAGTGECAAPRLLQYAFSHSLRPLCMGEFWYGASPENEVRNHGDFYPSCHHKCLPLLSWMMRGLSVEPNPLLAPPESEAEIVWQDKWLAVVNKPSGLASVEGKAHSRSLFSWARESFPDAAGPLITHRLDQATSGLVVIAKDGRTFTLMQQMFERGEVAKTYIALLRGNVAHDSGEVSLPLLPSITDRPRQMVDSHHGKPATTTFRTLMRIEGFSVVEFHPLQGRTHQIRVHAAHHRGLAAPVLGDTLYGVGSVSVSENIAMVIEREFGFPAPPPGGIWLRAVAVSFIHPVTNEQISLSLLPKK